MYLKQLRMARGQGEVEQRTGLRSHFVDRVVKLPMVHVAWDYATNTYTSIKESNRLVNFTLTNAERSVNFVAGQAKPVVMRFEKQIQAVDSLACKGLGTLEEKVPLITKSPDEIIVDTKNLYTANVSSRFQGIRKYSHDKVKSVTDYGLQKASFILGSRAVTTIQNSVDSVLVLTEHYVDYILPPPSKDANYSHQNNGTSKEDDEKKSTLDHLYRIYSTIRHRAPRIITIQLTKVRNAPDAVFTYAFTRLENVIVVSNSVWEALTSDEPRKNAQIEKLPFKDLIPLTRPVVKRMFDVYITLSQLLFASANEKSDVDSNNSSTDKQQGPVFVAVVRDNVLRIVGILRVVPSLIPMYAYHILSTLFGKENAEARENHDVIDGSVSREQNNLDGKTYQNNHVHENNISPHQEDGINS